MIGLAVGIFESTDQGISFDTDATAWKAAVIANSGTVSAGTFSAVSTFCKSAKANGYWTKLNRINLFCGDQLAAALVPLKVGSGNATDTNVSFVGGDYSESTGLTGNGTTKFLRTGLVPSVSLTLNDTHMAVYNRAGSAVGGNVHIGARDGTNFLEFLAPASTGDGISRQYALTTGELTATAPAAPYGLMLGTRTASNVHTIYRRGVSVASNATVSGALVAFELYVFGSNSSGGVLAATANALAGYSIGSGLTAGDATNYNTDIQTFQTTLSRQV